MRSRGLANLDLFTKPIDAWVARKSRELLSRRVESAKPPKADEAGTSRDAAGPSKPRDQSFEVSKVLRAFNDYERERNKKRKGKAAAGDGGAH